MFDVGCSMFSLCNRRTSNTQHRTSNAGSGRCFAGSSAAVNASAMLSTLLPLLALILLVVLGIALIVGALLEPPAGMTPSCARCGRDARELVDFTCPGCGH